MKYCFNSVGTAMSRFAFTLIFLQLGLLCLKVHAEPINLTLHPVADATLYESADGERADGAGPNLFVGRTGQGALSKRRATVRFDLSDVPSDVELLSAELTMNFRSSNPGDRQFDLHRLLNDWSEGPSASISGGQGVPASEGDTTWLHRDNPSSLWETEGGDFVSSASASLLVDSSGSFSWASTVSLLSDLETWIDDPSQNYGWIIVGDETRSRTVMQIASRSNPVEDFRPVLSIAYQQQAVPEPDCLSLAFVGLLILLRQTARNRRSA